MPHYRKLFDERFVGSWDLPADKPITVKIEKVGSDTVYDPKTKATENVPVLSFEGKQKTMVLNKTNAKAIARLHGDDTDKWIGKTIQLCVQDVSAFGEVWPAIRVANTRLQEAIQDKSEPAPDPGQLDEFKDEANPPEPEPPPIDDRGAHMAIIEKHLTKIGAMRSKTFLGAQNLDKTNWRDVSDQIMAEMAEEASK